MEDSVSDVALPGNVHIDTLLVFIQHSSGVLGFKGTHTIVIDMIYTSRESPTYKSLID